MTLHVNTDAFTRLRVPNARLTGSSSNARASSQAGFVPAHPRVHAFYNRSIGVIALIAVSPIMIIITLALWLTQGSGIFYAGARLGKDRKPFNIYKFRTLDSAKAKLITADKVLPANSNIETPLGKYLRASRLDELPQLFNIVSGDMNIVGPRPVRPEIAAIEQLRNPDYDIRFCVKPGLVGQTQAYMCHGTSKAIRAKYNYMLCVNRVNYLREVGLFMRVGFAVLGRAAALIAQKMRPTDLARAARECADKWGLQLVQGNRVHSVLAYTDGGLALADRSITGPAELLIRTRSGGLRRARIHLEPLRTSTPDRIASHRFECTTQLSSHLVYRFLADSAVVGPRPAKKPLGHHALVRVRAKWATFSSRARPASSVDR